MSVVDRFADESPDGTTSVQEEEGAARSTSIRVGLQSLIRLVDGVASQEKGIARSEEEAAYAEDVTGAGSLLTVPTWPQGLQTRSCSATAPVGVAVLGIVFLHI